MKKITKILILGLAAFACTFFYGCNTRFDQLVLQEKESLPKEKKSELEEKESAAQEEEVVKQKDDEQKEKGETKKEKESPQKNESKITSSNYKEKVINKIISYIDEKNSSSGYGIYPFSTVVDSQLKWGFRDKNRNVIVEPLYDRVYADWQSGVFGVQVDGKYHFLNMQTKAPEENSYDQLVYRSKNIESIVNEEEKRIYVNPKGEILGDEKNASFEGEYLFCVQKEENKHMYLLNGEYLGWTSENFWNVDRDVEIALFERDGAECSEDRYIKFKDDSEMFNVNVSRDTNYWKYIGEGIVKYMENICQFDDKLKLFTIKNLKTGQKTEEIFHQVIRIDKERILGVTPVGIKILDNDLNVIIEKDMSYYEKYFIDGDLIIGENEDGNKYNVFLNKDCDILWEENITQMSKIELKCNGYSQHSQPKYKKYSMIHSLQRVIKEVFFEEEYREVDRYIKENIIDKVHENTESLLDSKEEGCMRMHAFSQVLTKEFGELVIIQYRSGGHLYGGGNFGGGKSETIYITKDGEELDKNQLLVDGWEEKAEEIIKRWWDENQLEYREINFDNIDFEIGEDGIRMVKKSYYRGIADWMIDILLLKEDMEKLIDTESRIYKLAYPAKG
ncbi:WG repeat-containing protein [Oceanirhabdus sp. W0125-5]|uniref:WG repeat-containing protein n=1 Tax=Oceanirhabdus sp. W0125-5 TaxID=2999116 RepID=UPI0022F2B28B|nr:WG repeat-containing protein [Oceanirhabdus sp. W0125-5]WBW97134.1 WG repeat-containing protein [Oceanirhabdus sp. W0125-5]